MARSELIAESLEVPVKLPLCAKIYSGVPQAKIENHIILYHIYSYCIILYIYHVI